MGNAVGTRASVSEMTRFNKVKEYPVFWVGSKLRNALSSMQVVFANTIFQCKKKGNFVKRSC